MPATAIAGSKALRSQVAGGWERIAVKRLFVKTYGCQMNVYDSERMAESLKPHGYERADRPEDADVVLLNTCHIREKAAEKVYSELGRLRQLRARRERDGGGLELVVAGCVAQAEGEAMGARAPFVDVIVGPQSYHLLPELMAKRRRAQGDGPTLATDFPVESKFDALPGRDAPAGPSAFLTVQEGCDKFCSFCVVPYTRGAEDSRPAAAILAEARELVAKGAREITLLGQNVNAYHGEGPDGRQWGLARLFHELAEIDGLERLRYTTSHPKDMDDALIRAHGAIAKLAPFLHLPVQSGSDRVLAAMNRKHSAADYCDIVDRLRAARPDIALSSDFITGFPGESDEDFEATMELVEKVEFALAFSFKYSPRPGTPAATMRKQVKEEVKAERLARLQALLEAQQKAFNEKTVGVRTELLLERTGRKDGQMVGRTPWLQAAHLEGDGLAIGDIVPVEITAAAAHSLAARAIGAPDRRRAPTIAAAPSQMEARA